ncbi:MAG: alpha/beta fold hydrolase [Candidatus Angelobacter sp.]
MSNVSLVPSTGARIEVITSGATTAKHAGPSIVMLACGGGSNPLERLSSPVVEMQLRGYGTSAEDSSTHAAPSLSDHIGDIDAVLGHFRFDRPILLGYSHGGYFTTAYAIANPGRIAGLILVEPALFNQREELLQRAQLAKEGKNEESMKAMLRHVQPSIGLNAGRSSEVAKSLLTNVRGKETLANEFLLRANNPIQEDELASLKMPVLLVGGTRSHAANTVTRLSRILPSASLWWVRGAQHLDLMSQGISAQLEPVVNSFLAGLSQ